MNESIALVEPCTKKKNWDASNHSQKNGLRMFVHWVFYLLTRTLAATPVKTSSSFPQSSRGPYNWGGLLKFRGVYSLMTYFGSIFGNSYNFWLIPKFRCIGAAFQLLSNKYPPITYYWTVPLILDHSYLVGKVTSSKIVDTKVSGF
jgi:hypothetical protein